jgi:hypothetical protein
MASTLHALRAALVCLLTLSLIACGGGGGDDDEEDDPIGGVEDADASGLWLGTLTLGGTARTFRVLAAPSGQFVGLIFASAAGATDSRTLIGTGDATGNQISGTGTAFASAASPFPNGSPIAALTISGGQVTERVSLSGTYAAGGESGPFTLSYQTALTDRGASLATVAGTYTLLPTPSGATATVTINSAGAATYNSSSGCVGNGNFAVLDAALNMYSWTLAITSCPSIPDSSPSGLAILDDYNGAQGNLLAMFGAPPARDRLFVFIGAK